MAKEKVFHFRIKEVTEHFLGTEKGVAVVKDFSPYYKLYKKVPLIFGRWKNIPNIGSTNFYSIDEAKAHAEVYVNRWKKDYLKKKHKKELKTTVKIVVDFDIPA